MKKNVLVLLPLFICSLSGCNSGGSASYTVTFNGNGGTLISGNEIQTVRQPSDIVPPTYEKKGYTFSDWDKDISTITTYATITATWDINQYKVIVENPDPTKGTVSGGGEFDFESAVTITASPNMGYDFLGWYKDGKLVSQETSYRITIPNCDVTYTAKWSNLIKPTLSILDCNNDWGHTTGSGDYLYNQQVTVTAAPNSGCSFGGWYDNSGSCLSSDLSYTFAMSKNDLTIYAIFNKDGQSFTFSKFMDGTLAIKSCTTSNETVDIPEYGVYYNYVYPITSLASSAFSGDSITSINIPSNITTVGNYAFGDCYLLTNVTMESGVLSIGRQAFYDCIALESISFSNTVVSLGADALYNCKKLTSLVLPNTITFIGDGAFDKCSSLNSLTLPSLCNQRLIYYFDNSSSGVPSSLKTVTLTNCEEVGGAAFAECSKITKVVVNEGATIIGGSAFNRCSALSSITLPSTLQIIGDYAFAECESLASISIPNNVYKIGESAFNSCTNLASISFPSNLKELGTDAFKYCPKIQYYTVDNGKYLGNSSNNYVALVQPSSSSIASCYIHPDCKVIAPSAFSGCSSMTYVSIPSGITTVGTSAFAGCTSLQYNTYDNALYLGNSTNNYVVLMKPTERSITSCNIHPDCKVITYNAFSECTSLNSITIPNGIVSIGDYAFSNCTSLTSITIPSTVTSIGEHVFYDCSGLTSINIAAGITSIPDYAFAGCSSLESFNIPSGVISIGDTAFASCKKLASITIPNTVRSIAWYAFSSCEALSTVIIPNSMESIGSRAFSSCIGLTLLDLTNCDHVVSAGTYPLEYTMGSMKIKVKKSLLDQYKNAENWSTYSNRIISDD